MSPALPKLPKLPNPLNTPTERKVSGGTKGVRAAGAMALAWATKALNRVKRLKVPKGPKSLKLPKFDTSGLPRIRWHLPEGWLRATFQGFQAFMWFWLGINAVALACYVEVAADPALNGTSWPDAITIGNVITAMSWGANYSIPADLGGGLVAWIPLGLTIASLLMVRAFVARLRGTSWQAGLFAIIGATIFAWFTLFFLPEGVAVLPAFLGVPVIAGIGVILGLRKSGAFNLEDTDVATWWQRPGFSAGLRGLSLSLRALVVLGLGLVVLALAFGWEATTDIAQNLNLGVVGLIGLILMCLAYLPNVVVLALAWLSGPGFHLGNNAVFSPGFVTPSAMRGVENVEGMENSPPPQIPLLGILPQGAPGFFVIAIPIALGVLLGIWLRRQKLSLIETLEAGLTVLISIVVIFAVALVLGSGGIGAGSLQVIAPFKASVFALSLEAGASCIAVALGTHHDTISGARRVLTRAYRKIRGQGVAVSLKETQGSPDA
ncbi:MAG: DUF6350 family protein [Actinomycetaceae bacterium]|nr:DUF6350 family protein [Actinomycetaceae bacterium]